MAQRQYLKGIAKEFGPFNNLSVSLNVSELEKYVDSKGFVKVVLSRRKELGQFGETHSIYLDDFNSSKSQVKGAEADNDLGW
jgi:hypothetical protein